MSEVTDEYDTYVRGADPHDRRTFDAHLLGWLLNAATAEERTAALEAAAAFVNGGAAGLSDAGGRVEP